MPLIVIVISVRIWYSTIIIPMYSIKKYKNVNFQPWADPVITTAYTSMLQKAR